MFYKEIKRKHIEKDLDFLLMKSIQNTYGKKAMLRKTYAERHFTQDGKRDSVAIGTPDLVGHIYGIHVEIEDKVYPNYPTSEQKRELKKVNETGGIGVIILRKEEQYWLVHPDGIESFSYKNKKFWLPLTLLTGDYLNLSPLNNLILIRMFEIKKLIGDSNE